MIFDFCMVQIYSCFFSKIVEVEIFVRLLFFIDVNRKINGIRGKWLLVYEFETFARINRYESTPKILRSESRLILEDTCTVGTVLTAQCFAHTESTDGQ